MVEVVKLTPEDQAAITTYLESGVVECAAHPGLEDALALVKTMASTLDQVYADGRIGREDFDSFKALWEQSFVVADEAAAIEAEAQALGPVGKVVVGIKALLALRVLVKAIQQAAKNRAALTAAPVVDTVGPA